jgi:hypothetical protein
MSANGDAPLSQAEYADLVARVRATAGGRIPPGSSALVISKGDAALLSIPGLSTAHFPQDGAGEYAGHHPRDGAAAIAALEELRRSGAEYLVIPATARWWLDYYAELATHLATHGEVVVDEPESCLIYGLGAFEVAGGGTGAPGTSLEQMRDYLEHLLSTDAELVVLEEEVGLAGGLEPLRAVGVRAAEPAAKAKSLLAELERLARGGADYLVVPRRVDDWFDRTSGIGAPVEASCRKVADQRHLCRVFDLADMRGLRR